MRSYLGCPSSACPTSMETMHRRDRYPRGDTGRHPVREVRHPTGHGLGTIPVEHSSQENNYDKNKMGGEHRHRDQRTRASSAIALRTKTRARPMDHTLDKPRQPGDRPNHPPGPEQRAVGLGEAHQTDTSIPSHPPSGQEHRPTNPGTYGERMPMATKGGNRLVDCYGK